MVQQPWGDTPSEGFSDNPSPSDNDPYASPSSSSPARLDDTKYPRPMWLNPFKREIFRKHTEETLAYSETILGRPLTQQEYDVLGYHIYKAERTSSIAANVGGLLGLLRAYQTMSVYRYPWYLPKPESINPNKFLVFKGPIANVARHSWRFGLYYWFGSSMTNLVSTIYAQSSAARDAANDPRFSQFTEEFKAGIARRAQIRGAANSSQKNQDGTTVPQALPPHAGAPVWPRRKPTSAPHRTPEDEDMSPTAGNDPWPAAGLQDDSPFVPDHPEGQQGQQSSYSTPPSNSYRRQANQSGEDGASPTEGLFGEDAANQAKPGESTWERLRRGGGPPAGQRPQPPQRRPETSRWGPRERSDLGDSFTFAGTAEERKLAQEKAQREFDERIERERQGKDFSEDDKRW